MQGENEQGRIREIIREMKLGMRPEGKKRGYATGREEKNGEGEKGTEGREGKLRKEKEKAKAKEMREN